MTRNEEILAQLNEQKERNPFEVYRRFNKAFYFPGVGHSILGIKPKNILFPFVGALLFSSLVVALILFFGNLGTVSSLAEYKKNPARALLHYSDTRTIQSFFITHNVRGATKDVLSRLNDLQLEKEKAISSAISEIESAYDSIISENSKLIGSQQRDEAEIVKERDSKIEKAKEKIFKINADTLPDVLGEYLFSYNTTQEFDDLLSEYLSRFRNGRTMLILSFLLFLVFWIYTVVDLIKIYQFGKLNRRIRDIVTGVCFLGPNILGFMTFTFVPIIASFLLAFSSWDILGKPEWIGLANFIKLFKDPLFYKYLYNTFYFFVNIPLGMAVSVVIALALNQKLRGIVFFRTLFYLPAVCSMVAIALLWRWIYNPDFGIFNTFLRAIGISNPPSWLSSTIWAKPALTIMMVWGGVGGSTIIYLASLQGIGDHLYEAAQIDGANGMKRFFYITLPLLGPTHFFLIITGVISTFQSFGQQFVMTQGGPAGSTTTIVYYIYNNAFQWFKMGYASSIAWVLFVMVLVVTLFNWKYTGKISE